MRTTLTSTTRTTFTSTTVGPCTATYEYAPNWPVQVKDVAIAKNGHVYWVTGATNDLNVYRSDPTGIPNMGEWKRATGVADPSNFYWVSVAVDNQESVWLQDSTCGIWKFKQDGTNTYFPFKLIGYPGISMKAGDRFAGMERNPTSGELIMVCGNSSTLAPFILKFDPNTGNSTVLISDQQLSPFAATPPQIKAFAIDWTNGYMYTSWDYPPNSALFPARWDITGGAVYTNVSITGISASHAIYAWSVDAATGKLYGVSTASNQYTLWRWDVGALSAPTQLLTASVGGPTSYDTFPVAELGLRVFNGTYLYFTGYPNVRLRRVALSNPGGTNQNLADGVFSAFGVYAAGTPNNTLFLDGPTMNGLKWFKYEIKSDFAGGIVASNLGIDVGTPSKTAVYDASTGYLYWGTLASELWRVNVAGGNSTMEKLSGNVFGTLDQLARGPGGKIYILANNSYVSLL